jgi:hypothetical protein
MLQNAEHPVTDGVCAPTRRADWAHGVRGCLTWGMPAALLIISPAQYFVIVWPTLLTFMGVACLLNARRCGRIHCYFTGPFFLLLAGGWASIWPQRAAARREGLVDAVSGPRDRQRNPALRAPSGFSAGTDLCRLI